MNEISAEPQDYSLAWNAPRPDDRRGPDILFLSLVAAVMTLCVSGTVIGDHLAHLPDTDSLFQPRLVQTTPPPARIGALQVLALDNGPEGIDLAPTAPVSIDPYPVQAQATNPAEAAAYRQDRTPAQSLAN
ncbi:hypothetical protein [Asticcacaulis sp. EMRT-3]|uniref:hypothetical protein n=1 Tax=Asticcacaulis sp. EMRT-3 TaxID=3040349 RepID=UPI0024AFDBA1|nr:hypothetical protein [Asticcacaulis sp. EMRT-3]MDI7773804.1 hypothetical protein [Asticcacaulis sp. EMRT-3]